jgi:uncharacterized membrane protein
MKTSINTNGFLMATAVAALFMNSPVMAEEQAAQEAKVHCAGINSCKGTSECKTASNECKGKNACSGKGFISTTEKECSEKGGKVI